MRIRRAVPTGFGVFLVVGVSACSIIPYEHGTRANEPLSEQTVTTRGSERVSYEDLPEHKVFIGISLSGGGNRAANFSVAALRELEKLGVVQQASAVSSVSGGSLAATYFGMYGNGRDPTRWNDEEIARRFKQDLRTQWILRWFLPQNALRFWFTPFDRSDIMKGVIDDALFDGAESKFAAMGTGLPRILINASNLVGQNFVFTEERFRDLGSRLDTYPISHAVMASAAFPGAFNNVTLEDYSSKDRRTYLHLLDGGPTDNLGVKALRRTLNNLDRSEPSRPLKGCLFVVIDAFPDPLGKSEERVTGHDQRYDRDPRRFLDYFFDDNLLNAFDDLLLDHREEMLRTMGNPAVKTGEVSFWTYRPFRDNAQSVNQSLACHVWHLTFQTLARFTAVDPAVESLGKLVNDIQTDLRLRAPGERDAGRLQKALFDAAELVIWKDHKALTQVRELFRQWGIESQKR